MLRGLLIGQVTDYWLDFGVLTVAPAVGIAGSVALLPRLAR
jgi:ABC-2 type transport system permease protein